MTIDFPQRGQIPELKALWTEAFGEEEFWDTFFSRVFSADRCRCITVSGRLAAALFWLDCSWKGRKTAYLYAVATREDFRRRGLCRALLENTHALLKQQGYEAAMLVPETDALRRMYAGMGYETCTYVQEFSAEAGEDTAEIRPVSPEEYAARRRALLPENSVLQEGKNLDLLKVTSECWAGKDFLFAASQNGDTLRIAEFLGDVRAVPAILHTLGCSRGIVRMPGANKPFLMICIFTQCGEKPSYFGFAFD